MRQKLATLAADPHGPATLDALMRLQQSAVEHVSNAPELRPIEVSDREDAIADWLADHAIADGWDLAPTFVRPGSTPAGWTRSRPVSRTRAPWSSPCGGSTITRFKVHLPLHSPDPTA